MKIRIIIYSFLALYFSSCSNDNNLIRYVDPFIGSDAHGHVFVGANVPFGGVQVGPANFHKGWDWTSSYHYSDSIIKGFGHLKLSGTGIGDLGEILLMPATGDVLLTPGFNDYENGYASKYSKTDEYVSPGYYNVLLEKYNIRAELTATKRSGLHRYTFPKSSKSRVIINHFKDTREYKRIVVIGHSEGALIGMIASRLIADSFISIAGAGEDYLALIQRQLSIQPLYVKSMSDPIIEKLKNKELVDSVPPLLNSLFNKTVQQYLIDASSYDPKEQISKLDIPVLIVQGSNDIQIEVKDAQLLHNAATKSRLEIIQGMNHVLRQAPQNRLLNMQTYGNPELPIDNSLVNIIVDFLYED